MIKDYQVSKEELADRQMRLTISIPNETLEPELRNVARRIAKNISVPGFRKGKAPYNVLLAYYGRDALAEEWYEKEGDAFFQKVLETEGIKPFRSPTLEDVNWSPFSMVVSVPEEPVVNLPDYHAMRVEKPEVADVDALLEKQLKTWREKYATWEDVDRPVDADDKVTFDFKLHKGDEILVDQTDMVKELGDEESFVPHLGENLLGMTAGESKSYTVSFGDDSESSWTGDVTIDVTVKKVQGRKPAELSEEIVTRIVADEKLSGEIKTEEDLRNLLRPIIREDAENKARDEYFDRILEALSEQSEVLFPPVLLEERLDESVDELKQRLKESGLDWEYYLKTAQTTEDDIRGRYRDDAARMTRYGLILRQIIEQEGLDIKPEDIDAEIERILGEMDPLMRETSRKLYESEKQRHEIGLKLLNDHVRNFLETLFSSEEEMAEPDAVVNTETAAEANTKTAAVEVEDTSETQASLDGDAEAGAQTEKVSD